MIRTGKHRVLLVEDDPAVRDMVAAHLARQGYEVVAASSGEEVLRMLRDGTLGYDVALTDVHLPGITGTELCRLLLAMAPLKPVVLITGDDDEALAAEALGHGAAAYLLKPFQLFELDAALAQAVSMLALVEATQTLARAQAETLDDWGEAGGLLPRAWLYIGDERSGARNGHGARVVSIAALVAKALGPRLDGRARDVLRTAARTHEIGRLLGLGGDGEVAAKTAQMLDDLGFDPAVGDVVRDAALPWSPGLPLAARLLAAADRLDHDAVRRSEAGTEDVEAIRAAIHAAVEEAGDTIDPAIAGILSRERENIASMWLLQRRTPAPGRADAATTSRAGPGAAFGSRS